MKNFILGVKYILVEDFQELWDAMVYAAFKAEAIELLPHLIVLSGGQMREGVKKLDVYNMTLIDKVDV